MNIPKSVKLLGTGRWSETSLVRKVASPKRR